MSITTIIGPMFSGKTSEMVRLIDRKRIAGYRCLIIKHCDDNRFDLKLCDSEKIDKNHITTHGDIRYTKTDICYYKSLDLMLAEKIVNDKSYDVVAIDEGFLFGENIVEFCNYLANRNIEVIVSTIESSYKQKILPGIANLIAISEDLIKLKSICINCKKDASFNIRTIDSNKDILVGGADIYKSVCRSCMNNFKSAQFIK